MSNHISVNFISKKNFQDSRHLIINVKNDNNNDNHKIHEIN